MKNNTIVADLTYTDLEIIALSELYWRQSIGRTYYNQDVFRRLTEYEKTGEMQEHMLKMRELVARSRALECL